MMEVNGSRVLYTDRTLAMGFASVSTKGEHGGVGDVRRYSKCKWVGNGGKRERSSEGHKKNAVALVQRR